MSEQTIADELNKLFSSDMEKYTNEVQFFKQRGYKIYRNSDGLHFVVVPKQKPKDTLGMNGLFNMFFGGSNNES